MSKLKNSSPEHRSRRLAPRKLSDRRMADLQDSDTQRLRDPIEARQREEHVLLYEGRVLELFTPPGWRL